MVRSRASESAGKRVTPISLPEPGPAAATSGQETHAELKEPRRTATSSEQGESNDRSDVTEAEGYAEFVSARWPSS